MGGAALFTLSVLFGFVQRSGVTGKTASLIEATACSPLGKGDCQTAESCEWRASDATCIISLSSSSSSSPTAAPALLPSPAPASSEEGKLKTDSANDDDMLIPGVDDDNTSCEDITGEGECKTVSSCEWRARDATCLKSESADDENDATAAADDSNSTAPPLLPFTCTQRAEEQADDGDDASNSGDDASNAGGSSTTSSSHGALVYKRTHASIDALGDAAFLSYFFGLNVSTNETFVSKGGDLCAHRLILNVMPNFQLHFFQSELSPEGPIANADWVAYFRRLHAGFALNRSQAWDGFMANSMTFYSPDLSPFVRRLRGAGVPVFAAKYDQNLGTCDDDDANDNSSACANVTLYSASVVVPGTGNLLEVVSEHVGGALQADFKAFPARACRRAEEVRQTVSQMRAKWCDAGGLMEGGAHALPDLLVVKLSYPGSVDDFKAFFEGVVGYPSSSLDRASDAAEGCAWTTLQVGSNTDVRVVEAPTARAGSRSTATWSDYVRDVHAKWTGYDEGWDRYLDNHFGVAISGGSLDGFVDKLRARNVSYRAQAGAGTCGRAVGCVNRTDAGSIWTGGMDAQGVELHGLFNWSVFVEANTTGMDYCASPAVAGVAVRRSDRNTTANLTTANRE